MRKMSVCAASLEYDENFVANADIGRRVLSGYQSRVGGWSPGSLISVSDQRL